MFGSAVLDVALGLTLVYLFFSLLCSVIREGIARILRERERGLIRGLYRFLGEEPPQALLTVAFTQGPAPAPRPVVAGLPNAPEAPAGTGASPAAAHAEAIARGAHFDEHALVRYVLNHSLVRGLSATDKTLPAYVTSRAFALALLDALAPTGKEPRSIETVRTMIENIPQARVRQALLPLLHEAGDDVVALQNAIEEQFNDAMDEISRWYKRHSQMWIAALALLVCFAGNLDSIAIANTLWREPTVRAHAVAMAASVKAPTVDSPTPTDVLDAYKRSNDALRTLELPLGWDHLPKSSHDWPLTRIVGCILSALALLLGAPFWFQVLQRVVSVRGDAPKAGSS